MAPLPAPGSTGKAATGNAFTDANQNGPVVGAGRGAGSPGTVNVAQQQAQINAINKKNADAASDCLWPPSGKISVPIIPGVYTQSFNLPCLFSYGEARAVLGALLLVAGSLIMGFGVGIIAFVEAGPTAAEAGGVAASLAGAPEVGIPVAAAGAEAKHKQKQAAAKPPAKQQMATAS